MLNIWMELLVYSFMVYAAKVNRFFSLVEVLTTLFPYILCYFRFHLDISIPIMRFFTEMMIISQNVHHCQTFTEQLNELRLSIKIKETVKRFIFNADISSQAVVNWYETEPPIDEKYATEILYRQLAELFEHFHDSASVKIIPSECRDKCFEYVCKSLETLLKCSDKARALATNDEFVLSIVIQIEGVYNNMGGGLKEFVRKTSNDKVNDQFVFSLCPICIVRAVVI